MLFVPGSILGKTGPVLETLEISTLDIALKSFPNILDENLWVDVNKNQTRFETQYVYKYLRDETNLV